MPTVIWLNTGVATTCGCSFGPQQKVELLPSAHVSPLDLDREERRMTSTVRFPRALAAATVRVACPPPYEWTSEESPAAKAGAACATFGSLLVQTGASGMRMTGIGCP